MSVKVPHAPVRLCGGVVNFAAGIRLWKVIIGSLITPSLSLGCRLYAYLSRNIQIQDNNVLKQDILFLESGRMMAAKLDSPVCSYKPFLALDVIYGMD